MPTRSIAATVTLLLLIGGGRVDGQELSLALQGGEISDETGAARTGATVLPELRWLTGTWSGRVGASATLFRDGALVGGAVVEVDGAPWSAGALSLVVGGTGSGAASDGGYRALSLGLYPGARVTAGPVAIEGRAMLRAAGEAQPADRAWKGFLPLGNGAGQDRMTWRRAQGAAVTLSGALASIDGRLGWRRMGAGAGIAWTDWTAAAGTRLGAVEGTVEVGRRRGVGSGEWAALGATVAVSRAAAVTGGIGSTPSDPLTGRAAGRFATVGLRLRVGGAPREGGGALLPPPVPAGTTRIGVRAASGSTVELMGDWSGWRALPVPEVAPGEFATEVVLGPGIHRFAFRVDGRWTLPAGYPTEPDEYGGRRAVLRVAAPGEREPE